MGLDGLLRGRSDRAEWNPQRDRHLVWNPRTDRYIASTFAATRLEKRALNKAALQQRLGLRVAPEVLLLGVISRMSWQKGLDLLLEALPAVLHDDGKSRCSEMAISIWKTATGPPRKPTPARSACGSATTRSLAHLIQAGSDALVVPSRFEPCGLTQLCALRYGAVPVVSRVGGLADTVVDADEPRIASGSRPASI